MSRFPSREEALFADALAQPPVQREAYLAKVCQDDAGLLARVIDLVAAHEEPDSLLAKPGEAAQRICVVPEEKPGDRIGPYKLLLRIGEGGCGVVFLAEQRDPMRRRVALKVIKAGMDTREVIARFEAERQALAMMDHPGICKVLDAGATEAGRPYFVMEFVRGAPITKYCDENQLPTAARLELFMQVCRAVQHAHQKGIIHRDLKPSNILVTLQETAAVPKVIDFGIAKATQGRLTDATLVTAFEQFLGTPAYMSPEQAEMSGLDIDTRSDVYSLGVLLYELLAGRPPFDPQSLKLANRDELLRIIRSVEPPKPSKHLATLAGGDRSFIAQRRGTDPAKLRLLLCGDLDWIVMKALEKNRVRRYDTPSALADDIARHFRHEPIVARSPGRFYRLVKFTRRNRLVVAAAAAVTTVLVAGSIVSTWQAVRAKHAERVANEERGRAQAAGARAEALIDFMLGEFLNEVQKLGRLDLLEMLGARATAYFASLDPRDLSDATLLQKVKSLRQAGEVRFNKGRLGEASESFAAAYVRAAALVARQPKNGDMLFERGQAEYWIGALARSRGDLASAGEWLTKYRDTAVALTELDPSLPAWRRELASGHQVVAVLNSDRGKLDAARRGFFEQMELLAQLSAESPADRGLLASIAEVHSWLGSLAERRGDYAEAVRRFAEQVAQLEAIERAEPKNMRWRGKLAGSLNLYSGILAITGERTASLRRRSEARAILDQLVAADPQNGTRLRESLFARLREARLMRAEDNVARASALIDEVLGKLEKLASAEPTDRILMGRLAVACRLQAEISFAHGQLNAASGAIMRAIKLGDAEILQGGADRHTLGEASLAYIAAGTIAAHGGNGDDAVRHWQRALELLRPHLPDSDDWVILDPAARTLALLGRHDESRAIVARLHGFGYRPLEPWPEIAGTPVLVGKDSNSNLQQN